MGKGKGPAGLIMKRDAWVLGAALGLLALSALLLLRPASGDRVRVYLDGALYAEAPLDKDQVIVIDQPDGKRNELVIQDGQAFMRAASCKNQDCVRQSPLAGDGAGVRPLGDWIICLPNKVSVELVEAGE